jgi:hypothetical protein
MRFLEPKSGHTIRVYECECGQKTWLSEAGLKQGSISLN